MYITYPANLFIMIEGERKSLLNKHKFKNHSYKASATEHSGRSPTH